MFAIDNMALNEAQARILAGSSLRSIADYLAQLDNLFDRFPALGDVAPGAMARTFAGSFDEVGAEAAALACLFLEPEDALRSSDPERFRAAMMAAGYEASEDRAFYRKRFGYHEINLESPDRNVPAHADNWRVRLLLNGASFNLWSRANFPDVPAALRYAVAHIEAIDEVQAAFRPDGLADLEPEIRARLVDEMGFEAETVGGGLNALVSNGTAGHVMVSCFEGGGLPTSTDWHVCAYAATDPGEPILDISFDPADLPNGNPLTLFEAVAACLSVIAERGER